MGGSKGGLKTYCHLCPRCRPVEDPLPHSWHLQEAPVMA